MHDSQYMMDLWVAANNKLRNQIRKGEIVDYDSNEDFLDDVVGTIPEINPDVRKQMRINDNVENYQYYVEQDNCEIDELVNQYASDIEYFEEMS